MSLTRLARESLDRYGEYVALAFEGRQYTNLEQDRAAGRLANALRRLGVCPGDRVMVMLPNCPEVTQSYAAILKCGGVIVPVIFLLGDREVAHILADSEARIVITSADMLWKVEAQIGVLPSLRHVLLVDGGGDGKTRSLGAAAAQEEEGFATVERRAVDCEQRELRARRGASPLERQPSEDPAEQRRELVGVGGPQRDGRTTWRSSSTPRAPPESRREWRSRTTTSNPTPARRRRSTSWSGRTGRCRCCLCPTRTGSR